MNKTILLGSIIAGIIMSYGMTGVAFAQYFGNVGPAGETGVGTLEETLKLAQVRIDIVAANKGAGSGTPYLDATGILGSTAIAAAVFGGIAGALFFKGRSGKYAAQGRG